MYCQGKGLTVFGAEMSDVYMFEWLREMAKAQSS